MIAVDTNLLVYAHRTDSPFHESASSLVRGLAEGRARWTIPWPVAHEFLAIVTHPKIYRPPTPMPIAVGQLQAWLSSPSVVVIHEGPGYLDVLSELCASGRIVGPAVHDARIASLCLFHGVDELWSADRDFTRFPRLRTRNPLTL